MGTELSKADILRLLKELDTELAARDAVGEVYMVGGAIMCLLFDACPSTRDVDALFRPKEQVREAAKCVAERLGAPIDWLNDAVKGFLSAQGDFEPYLDYANLKVFRPPPEYLLTMKCLAFRLGAEFHDENDIRYLLRYLNIETYDRAIATITRYYPKERFPQKAFYALEELLPPNA